MRRASGVEVDALGERRGDRCAAQAPGGVEVDALRQILGAKQVMSVDELRRGIESLPEATYHQLTYYQRWIRSITDTLLRKGVITEAELHAALGVG